MSFDTLRWVVSRRPGTVVLGWCALAAAVGLAAPSLTELAAEGQAKLLPRDSESARAAELVRRYWPDQSYASMAVVALHRPSGLVEADRAYAARLAGRFHAAGHPPTILRVLGPRSRPEVAGRLVSRDRTLQLVLVPLEIVFVSPACHETVAWLEEQARAPDLGRPDGLEVRWTGDAVIGRDYMKNVQTSLDRAVWVTVVLLLGVLLAVYRSLWLAAVPLITIGLSLVVSRGVLAWLGQAGWDMSPLVELFLVGLLFGSGTDFCLFLSWRFGEHWNASNPAGAMRATLKRSVGALLTSAGTVVAGLSLMGLTRFKLFSSTGPSVALGLALTLGATLTLTPALLILLARWRPRAFAGLTAPPSGFWNEYGHRVLARPFLTLAVTLLGMLPPAILGLGAPFVQDTFAEMPAWTDSVRNLELVASKFGVGFVAPLNVVLESRQDLRSSEGLALIDDVSRLLAHQRRLTEVRSATQPLGSTAPLEPARLSARLAAVNAGFARMADGAEQLRQGLMAGVGKLRTAIYLENLTGLHLTGAAPSVPGEKSGTTGESSSSHALVSGLKQATAALLGAKPSGLLEGGARALVESSPGPGRASTGEAPPARKAPDPRETMLAELTRAADGAGQIADGARRARREVASILDDPVGRRALDRLLITPVTVREHPELLESFAAYIAPDGHAARLDLTQSDRIFSVAAMDEVETLRRRLGEYLGELDDFEGVNARALFAGPNAGSTDVWRLTRNDQYLTWAIVPTGVFLILFIALRDLSACLNLVATMVLTYAFALGITHLVFVTYLGAEGVDWKVPYFLFVILVAVGVDYNVFLMTRLQEEARALGLKAGTNRAIAQTGGLISSAAAITACSFASFLSSPLGSLRQLGFALVVGIAVDAVLVRPVLVPVGHWLLNRHREHRRVLALATPTLARMARVPD